VRLGVIADVHANFPALSACLEALDHRGIDALAALGDLVGYNAEPIPCVQLCAERVTAGVMGNHDHDAACRDLQSGTGSAARAAIEWTREQLGGEERRYLSSLPRSHAWRDAGVLLAHGCFLNETFFRGYVTSTMLEANLRAIAAREEWPRVALCGHTHIPAAGWLVRGEVHEEPRLERARWPAHAEAVLINPGAVGQPRDGDPRASCAIVDLEARTVEVVRVEYDVEATAAAIASAGLPGVLADRLSEGR
jgi:diadenosine tetraphosphatase ApaH/serine/threonine PP2A family protein phosphatase